MGKDICVTLRVKSYNINFSLEAIAYELFVIQGDLFKQIKSLLIRQIWA